MTSEQRKTRALNALLDSNTLTEAAEKAEISRRTLYNYIRYDGDFGAAYRAARDQITLEQLEALNSGTARATKLLMDIMDDTEQPASIRMKAAQTVLSTAAKQYELTQGAKIATTPFDELSL